MLTKIKKNIEKEAADHNEPTCSFFAVRLAGAHFVIKVNHVLIRKERSQAEILSWTENSFSDLY